MVLQLLAGLPSEYEILKKIISSRWPLPTFEDACSMVSMQERKFLQDHHEGQNTTDPRVGGEEESSSFFTLETGVTIAGIVGSLLGAFGFGGASRMIAIGSMSAVGAAWLENLADAKKKVINDMNRALVLLSTTLVSFLCLLF
ncbi:uncharacterized protein LOC132629331 [Lycium barbarum]|uniref:uncharacterized protein LOC132629331 n=1 Tax=Lycium barbarum TaxID=112863 RepID=UPI00293F61E7|nr:uncharacterized protein LOC132629331 [Lycium barbarum]